MAVGPFTDGTHSLTTTATDAAGNTSGQSDPYTFTVATQSPTVSAAETVSGLTNQNTDTITVTASAEAVGSNTVANVEIFDGGTDLGAATSNGNGTWSLTTGTLTDGAHNFSTTVTDAAGNTASATLAEVDVATQSPAAGLAESVSGLTNKTSDILTVTARAENVPVDSIANVEIFDGSADLGAATSNGNGTWNLTASGLTNGSHSFTALVTDAAGNSTTTNAETVTVKTSTSENAISDAAVVNGYINAVNFNGGKTTLSGQAEPGDTVSVAVTLNNGTPTTKLATVLSDGSWTLQLTGLKNGESVSALATATDAAGNTASSGTYSFTVDTAAPKAPTGLADSSILNGWVNGTNDTAAQTLTGQAEAGSTVTVYNGNAVLGTTKADPNTGAWSYTLGQLPNGAYSLTATATDAAGNTSSKSAALKFSVEQSTWENAITDSAVKQGADGNFYINAAHLNSNGKTTLTGTAQARRYDRGDEWLRGSGQNDSGRQQQLEPQHERDERPELQLHGDGDGRCGQHSVERPVQLHGRYVGADGQRQGGDHCPEQLHQLAVGYPERDRERGCGVRSGQRPAGWPQQHGGLELHR